MTLTLTEPFWIIMASIGCTMSLTLSVMIVWHCFQGCGWVEGKNE